MTSGVWEIVGQDNQELPLGTTIGNALRRLISRHYRHNAAKTIETKWKLDPKTAKNVVGRGNVSERTLTKALLAERWALWMALGEEVLEQTYAAYLEEVANERQTIADRAAADKDHLLRLEARAAGVVALLDGQGDRQPERLDGRVRASVDGPSAG